MTYFFFIVSVNIFVTIARGLAFSQPHETTRTKKKKKRKRRRRRRKGRTGRCALAPAPLATRSTPNWRICRAVIMAARPMVEQVSVTKILKTALLLKKTKMTNVILLYAKIN